LSANFLSAQVCRTLHRDSYGTLLGNGDDIVFGSVPLGFTSTTRAARSRHRGVEATASRGSGPNGNFDPRCCNGQGSQFVNDAPSIAAWWTDLVSDFGGASGVYFNSFPTAPW